MIVSTAMNNPECTENAEIEEEPPHKTLQVKLKGYSTKQANLNHKIYDTHRLAGASSEELPQEKLAVQSEFCYIHAERSPRCLKF